MARADIHEFERVHVYNINSGDRFETYAIAGNPGSGTIGLNGAAARKGHIGDRIIIVSYASVDENELLNYSPDIILLDENNEIKEEIE
jgi:aspartate 1-decarboxylase